MSKGNALAFFTGLGGGYLKSKADEDEKKRQDKRDARDEEDYQERRSERARAKTERETLATAGKTIEVEEGANGMIRPPSMDDRDIGLPENAAMKHGGLQPGGYRAGTQTFTNPAAASQAAAQANTPSGRTGRVAAALYGIGKPAEAMQMETAARQGELADLQLKNTKDTISREDMFREGATMLARGGWTAVPKMYEQYKDGKSAQVIEDGKGGATVIQIGPDGQETGRGTFANLEGFTLSLLPKLDPKLWVSETRLAKTHAEDLAFKKDTQKETARHNLATEKNSADLTAAKIDAATARAEAGRSRALAAGQPVTVTAKDLEDASKTISNRMTEIYQPKEGMDPKERDALGKQRDKAASEAHGIYRANNVQGNVIDTGTAIYAARLAADPKNMLQRQASDGNTYPGVVVNGAFVVTGAPLIKKDVKPPAAVPKPQPQAAAANGLPRSLGNIPGAVDTATRVSTAAELVAR